MGNSRKYASDTVERFQVRMYAGMRDRIAQSAEAQGRSMNTEIMARLEASFQPNPCGQIIDILIGALEAAVADGQIHRFIAAIKERRG
jgi:hypothetical protein